MFLQLKQGNLALAGVASSHRRKGRQFDSRMPGWQIQYLVRVCVEGNQSILLLSLSSSPPFSLKSK